MTSTHSLVFDAFKFAELASDFKNNCVPRTANALAEFLAPHCTNLHLVWGQLDAFGKYAICVPMIYSAFSSWNVHVFCLLRILTSNGKLPLRMDPLSPLQLNDFSQAEFSDVSKFAARLVQRFVSPYIRAAETTRQQFDDLLTELVLTIQGYLNSLISEAVFRGISVEYCLKVALEFYLKRKNLDEISRHIMSSTFNPDQSRLTLSETEEDSIEEFN